MEMSYASLKKILVVLFLEMVRVFCCNFHTNLAFIWRAKHLGKRGVNRGGLGRSAPSPPPFTLTTGTCVCAGKNAELVEKMETLFNVWHGQIEQVLTEHEQIRREADNIGPDVELQYWKNRMDKFHMYVPTLLAQRRSRDIARQFTPCGLRGLMRPIFTC